MTDDMDKLAETIATAVKNSSGSGNGQPWYFKLIGQLGVPAAIILALVWFGMTHGGAWVQSQVESQSRRDDEFSKYLETQVDTTKALADEAKKDRVFQKSVNDVHVTQLQALESINEQLSKANERMAPIPELRREQVELLKEIRDKN